MNDEAESTWFAGSARAGKYKLAWQAKLKPETSGAKRTETLAIKNARELEQKSEMIRTERDGSMVQIAHFLYAHLFQSGAATRSQKL